MPRKLKQQIVIPGNIGGWKERSYYWALVSHAENNPKHLAIIYSGFLTNQKPASYSCVWMGTYGNPYPLEELSYIELLEEIPRPLGLTKYEQQ